MTDIKISCETIHECYRNEGLVNLVEYLFRTPQTRLRAWKLVGWLRKNPWIEKKTRGRLVWSQTVKEEI